MNAALEPKTGKGCHEYLGVNITMSAPPFAPMASLILAE
jgi:hypothetical protein